MASSPIMVPVPAPASRSTRIPSLTMSTSYEEPRYACSSSSSSSSSSSGGAPYRRSSKHSTLTVRRGSSLPNSMIMPDPVARRGREREASGEGMSMLQFISSTATPSWAEIEASPMSLVPTLLPSMDAEAPDVDMVTFLREAPGVNRTPMSMEVEGSWWGVNDEDADMEEGESAWPTSTSLPATPALEDEHDDHRKQMIDAPAPEVSLLAFLEEGSMDGETYIPSPGTRVLGVADIYGSGPCSCSCGPVDSYDKLKLGPFEHAVNCVERTPATPTRPKIVRQPSDASTTRSSLKRGVSVSGVMRRAREAFRIGHRA
ncbi:hypothetical protein IAU60_001384 [Kwoniella sp. DSM 27419]